MKAVIDTSSLVSLVRYFLPFDKEGKLKAFQKDTRYLRHHRREDAEPSEFFVGK